MRQLHGLIARAARGNYTVETRRVNLRRAGGGRAREDEQARVARDLQVAIEAADEFPRRAVGERDVEDRLDAALAGDEVDGAAVGREGEVVNVCVEFGEKLARLLRLPVVEHQAPAVALEARSRLRAVGEVATVGRVARRLVRAAVAARETNRLAASDRHEEDIRVRRGGFDCVRVACEGEFFRVGREGVVYGVAQRERRRVEVAGREVARRAARRRDDEDVRALVALPLSPVPVEQARGDVRLRLARRGLLVARAVAGVVGAVGVNVRGEGNPLPVGRPQGAVRAGRDAGDLLASAARRVHRPELIAADEGERLAVGRPARLARGRRAVSQLLRLSAARRDQVNLRDAAVGGHVGQGDLIGHPMPVGALLQHT